MVLKWCKWTDGQTSMRMLHCCSNPPVYLGLAEIPHVTAVALELFISECFEDHPGVLFARVLIHFSLERFIGREVARPGCAVHGVNKVICITSLIPVWSTDDIVMRTWHRNLIKTDMFFGFYYRFRPNSHNQDHHQDHKEEKKVLVGLQHPEGGIQEDHPQNLFHHHCQVSQ